MRARLDKAEPEKQIKMLEFMHEFREKWLAFTFNNHRDFVDRN